ncbi:MAG: hypothetical protein M1819_001894 [Sarea resinae]|nr:MAG: hypothetical protein M1819_001894 [Sarea resinae]
MLPALWSTGMVMLASVQGFNLPSFSNMAAPTTPEVYTLPELPYAYDALEPHISTQIMTLHHSKHHQTYITNLNAALSAQATAISTNDIPSLISIQQKIKFNGGGHINHSLFWQNLAPASSPDTSLSTAAPKLKEAIERRWGSEEEYKKRFGEALLGLQGSGWGWLVKTKDGGLEIVTTKDQDPIVAPDVPLLGVDMWEHAYYLQYFNNKAQYVSGIWNIVNWKVAGERYQGGADVFSSFKSEL